jgi:hypothetical protein
MGGVPDINGVGSNLFDQPYGVEPAPQTEGNGSKGAEYSNGQGLTFMGRHMHIPGT